MLEAATAFAQTFGCTMCLWKVDCTRAIGIIAPARTISIITPVFTIPKPSARAFEAVDQGDTLDMGNGAIHK